MLIFRTDSKVLLFTETQDWILNSFVSCFDARKDGNRILCCHRGCGCYLHTWLVPKEEPNHFDQSRSSVVLNCKTADGKLWPLTACWRTPVRSHLQLVSVEAHQPLNSDFLARACVVDVFPLLQTALVHPHVCQLAELPRLITRKATGNNKALQIKTFPLSKKLQKDKRNER